MKGKILNVISILLGLMMILFGLNKFIHFIPMPELTPEQMAVFGHFGAITWLMPLVGLGEVLGGLALTIPKTRALGACMLFPVQLGIVLHAVTMDHSAMGMGIVLFAVLLWIIWEYKSSYMGMIQENK